MLSIEDLGDDVLEVIFSKLTLPERKILRLVNHHWLKLCNSARFTRRELIKLDFKDLDKLKTPRSCLNLQLNEVSFQPEVDSFWTSHGHTIRSLHVDNLQAYGPMLRRILNFCPNITEIFLHFKNNLIDDLIDFDDVNDNASASFKLVYLKSLKLSHSKVSLSNKALAEIMLLANSAPNVKWFACNDVVYGDVVGLSPFQSVVEKVLDLNCLEFISLSNADFSNLSLEPLEKFKHLKGLDLSETKFTEEGILNLLGQKVRPALIALKLSNLACVNDDLLTAILPLLPNLKFLDVSTCVQITSRGAQTVFKNCKKLTHLSLGSCPEIREVTTPISINSLINLVDLDLNFCHRLNLTNVDTFQFAELKTVGLASIPCSEEGLKLLLAQCPKLESVQFLFTDEEYIGGYSIFTESNVFTYDINDAFSIFDFSK